MVERTRGRRVEIRILTCSSPDRKTSHAWPLAWECSGTGCPSVRGRMLRQPAASEQTQEWEGAHGSESRVTVVVARMHEEEAGQIEFPQTSVLGEVKFVDQVSME